MIPSPPVVKYCTMPLSARSVDGGLREKMENGDLNNSKVQTRNSKILALPTTPPIISFLDDEGKFTIYNCQTKKILWDLSVDNLFGIGFVNNRFLIAIVSFKIIIYDFSASGLIFFNIILICQRRYRYTKFIKFSKSTSSISHSSKKTNANIIETTIRNTNSITQYISFYLVD